MTMGEALKLSDHQLFSPVTDPAQMADWITQFFPETEAEALKALRFHFPDRSLSARVAALHALMRRRPSGIGQH
jgi:hypothetical protein